MRYFYKKHDSCGAVYGEVYFCNHPVYSRCTLYLQDKKGMAVVQQRFNEYTKRTWWSEVDSYLVDDIYLNPNFESYFLLHASIASDGIYPTVTLRKIMWALRMKPLKKAPWETVFDRRFI